MADGRSVRQQQNSWENCSNRQREAEEEQTHCVWCWKLSVSFAHNNNFEQARSPAWLLLLLLVPSIYSYHQCHLVISSTAYTEMVLGTGAAARSSYNNNSSKVERFIRGEWLLESEREREERKDLVSGFNYTGEK